MSGYRQSSYDPDAYQQVGGPLRPFNWVQWTGVALEGAGMFLILADLAAKVSWVPAITAVPRIAPFMLLIIGVSLLNSRRAPAHDTSPEQHAANRRMLWITLAIAVLILGVAAAIEFLGAN